MKLVVNSNGGHYLIKVVGDVDLYSAPTLKEAFRDAKDSDYEGFQVDLADVHYIDSSGIGALLFGAGIAKKNGASIACINVREEIKALFQSVNLAGMFKVA